MKRHYRVSAVVRPAEQLCELSLRHLGADGGNFGCGLAQRIVALFVFGDIKKKPRLFEVRAVLRPGVDDAFEGRLFLEDRLRLFRVVPEIRLGGDLVQLLDPLLLALDVKDASAKARVALPGG
jgi:hypothetical protein